MEINIPKPTINANFKAGRNQTIEIAALIIIGLIFLWFVLLPKKADLKAKNMSLTALNGEYAALLDSKDKLVRLTQELKAQKQELVKLDEALPSHPRPTWMYLLVNELALSTGMTVVNATVNTPETEILAADREKIIAPFKDKRSLRKIHVNLSLTGTFAQFQGFIKKLENSARIIDVQVLEINSGSGGVMDFSLTFNSYYFYP